MLYILFYCILFCSILPLCSVLLYSILCSTLLYCILLFSILFNSIAFYTALFFISLFYSVNSMNWCVLCDGVVLCCTAGSTRGLKPQTLRKERVRQVTVQLTFILYFLFYIFPLFIAERLS